MRSQPVTCPCCERVERPRRDRGVRARWAAAGAALAVAVGAVGVSGTLPIVGATTSSGERAVYSAIAPCRLMDTRSATQVGPRGAPFGSNDTATVEARGAQGRCTADDLPDDAVALQLNVTAVGATLPTFLSITPDGSSDSSSLNPAPGEPPTPNAVSVDLDDDGAFKIFNKQGSVDVIVDVVGVYTDHDHDDRYYTKAEIDARVAPANPVELVVRPLDFTSLDSWSLQELLLASGNSGDGCASAPLDIAPGRSVESVELVYGADTAANVTVTVVSALASPATNVGESNLYDRHLLDDRSFPSTGPGENVVALTVTDDPTDQIAFPAQPLQPGHHPALRICTADPISILNAVVTLTPVS